MPEASAGLIYAGAPAGTKRGERKTCSKKVQEGKKPQNVVIALWRRRLREKGKKKGDHIQKKGGKPRRATRPSVCSSWNPGEGEKKERRADSWACQGKGEMKVTILVHLLSCVHSSTASERGKKRKKGRKGAGTTPPSIERKEEEVRSRQSCGSPVYLEKKKEGKKRIAPLASWGQNEREKKEGGKGPHSPFFRGCPFSYDGAL